MPCIKINPLQAYMLMDACDLSFPPLLSITPSPQLADHDSYQETVDQLVLSHIIDQEYHIDNDVFRWLHILGDNDNSFIYVRLTCGKDISHWCVVEQSDTLIYACKNSMYVWIGEEKNTLFPFFKSYFPTQESLPFIEFSVPYQVNHDILHALYEKKISSQGIFSSQFPADFQQMMTVGNPGKGSCVFAWHNHNETIIACVVTFTKLGYYFMIPSPDTMTFTPGNSTVFQTCLHRR